MATYIIAGMAIVCMTIILMQRVNLRRFLGYPNIVDISFTLVMLFMFHSTFSGIVAAAFAGVFMSIILNILRACIGAERLVWKRDRRIPYLAWERVTVSKPHWLARLLNLRMPTPSNAGGSSYRQA